MIKGRRLVDRPVVAALRDYPFSRLNALLADVPPLPGAEPAILSIGEPRRPPPRLIADAIEAAFDEWGRYPLIGGKRDLRLACADWLSRRFGLPAGMIDPDAHVLPVSGTREPLFLIAQMAVEKDFVDGGRPVVLMPDPAYHVYRAAALMAGAEPVFVPAGPDTGFIPDFGRLPEETLARACAAYLCSPANPQGAVGSFAALERAVHLALQHNFVLVADEVYSELYPPDRPPPIGLAEVCAATNPDMRNVLMFQSLSKRSNAAGLRSGFIAGDADLVGLMQLLRGFAGSPTPGPLQDAAAALWRDEAHVADNRAFYAANFELARQTLGAAAVPTQPDGGFFLWLDVGDGEAFAARAWREAAVKLMPGGYMTYGQDPGGTVGGRFVRIALVDPPSVLEPAFNRLAPLVQAATTVSAEIEEPAT